MSGIGWMSAAITVLLWGRFSPKMVGLICYWNGWVERLKAVRRCRFKAWQCWSEIVRFRQSKLLDQWHPDLRAVWNAMNEYLHCAHEILLRFDRVQNTVLP